MFHLQVQTTFGETKTELKLGLEKAASTLKYLLQIPNVWHTVLIKYGGEKIEDIRFLQQRHKQSLDIVSCSLVD